MKRFFVQTNGYNMVAFVDDSGKFYAVDETVFDVPLTLEVAKSADYSNFEDCVTAEECGACVDPKNVYSDFYEEFKDAFVVEF